MPVVLIALDSVGIDPLGHDQPESVYAGSRFLFPRGRTGPLLDLPDAPREGALVETDVTGGRSDGAIECAITYATIFSGIDALERHGLMEGLGTSDATLEAMLAERNLFASFERPCLANAIFPRELPFLRESYVSDLLPSVSLGQVQAEVTWDGGPLRLRGRRSERRGFAELFTVAEINQNIFVHAARAAGIELRTWEHVCAGAALTGSLTHALERSFDWSAWGLEPLPARTPAEGAAVLASLAGDHDFVFYKFQLADLVSHTGRVDLARAVFDEIEVFLEEVLVRLPEDQLVVVTSDHGHLEQVGFTQGHPKSKVPTWVFGRDARAQAELLTVPAEIFRLVDPAGGPG